MDRAACVYMYKCVYMYRTACSPIHVFYVGLHMFMIIGCICRATCSFWSYRTQVFMTMRLYV
jgi:hypothetical protein